MSETTTAPEVRAGRCQCGDITYEVTGAPDDPHLCSCGHCTLLSGSPAMSWVGFRNTLTVTGIQPPLNRFRFDTGTPILLRV
ncbi:GFA family protein, partial [Streptomyces canarius]